MRYFYIDGKKVKLEFNSPGKNPCEGCIFVLKCYCTRDYVKYMKYCCDPIVNKFHTHPKFILCNDL